MVISHALASHVVGRRAALPPPVISCAYPLNASLAQLHAIEFTGALALSNADQTGSYAVQGGLDALAVAGAAPDLSGYPMVPMLDFSSGRRAVEYAVSIPPDMETPSHLLIGTMSLSTLDQTHQVQISHGCSNDAVGAQTYLTTVYIDHVPVLSLGPMETPTQVFTVVIDADNSTVQILADGVPLLLSNDAVAPVPYVVVFQVVESLHMVTADAGKIFSLTLRSSAADIETTLPAGTCDGCGNPIG